MLYCSPTVSDRVRDTRSLYQGGRPAVVVLLRLHGCCPVVVGPTHLKKSTEVGFKGNVSWAPINAGVHLRDTKRVHVCKRA